jgi:hypothetical protein
VRGRSTIRKHRRSWTDRLHFHASALAANRMALAGLRLRHPERTDGELLLQLARLRLGDDLVRRVYGDAAPLE